MTIMRKGETHEQYMVRAYAERPAKMSEVVHLLEILTKSMDTHYNDLLDVTQKVAEDTARVVLELENRVVKLEEKHEDKQPTSGLVIWDCPCGYQNHGHICTKCGKPNSEGKNE